MRTDRGAMPAPGYRRRRVLAILAAAPGLLLPGRPGAEAPLVSWTGLVLGGVGRIALHHPNRDVARSLVAAAVQEIRRLEAMFSLWQPDSLITELNRRGVLIAPPPKMTDLLRRCLAVAQLTDGRFDPTVQPLWALYAAHFGTLGADPAGPPPEAVARALGCVGHGQLQVSPDSVVLARRGAALTLNGIAQGYLTDQIVALLRRGGVTQTMVDLGEARALGSHPTGRPWRATLSDPEAPEQGWGEVDLTDRALASSGDAGFLFDARGQFTHLLDPRSGRSPRLHRAIAVIAPDATLADALSTGFALMPEPAIAATLPRLPGVVVRVLRHDGSATQMGTG